MAIIQAFDSVIKDLEEYQGQDKPLYPTGLNVLDEMIWGFHESELCIVAGRPAEAKSSLLLYFALQFLKAEHKVLFFTLEMSKEELVRRMISQVLKIENTKLRRHLFNTIELENIKAQRQAFGAFPLDIVETGYNWMEIEAYVKSLKPKIVFFDYIQMMSTAKFSSTAEALSTYIRNFKELARKYKIIVIVASQVNRAPIARADRRPMQEDLKSSGGLEEASDTILANYWPWKYGAEKIEYFEIGIIKQRHGPIGRCRLKFNPQYFWFEDLENWELALWDEEEGKKRKYDARRIR